MSGATAPAWGGNVTLHVWMALAAGKPFTWGPHPNDRWSTGNAWVGTVTGPDAGSGAVDRLWIDVTCDTLELTISTGATRADGVFAEAEAGTAEITIADPARRLDPMNPDGPWRKRLNPGVPVLVWVEVTTDATVTRRPLFVGTVESFREPWTPHPAQRRCTVTAVDATAALVALERPELAAPVGAGDTTDARLARVLAYHSAPVTLDAPPSTVTLGGTTMDDSAWSEINAAITAEAGFAHVAATGDPLTADAVTDLATLRFVPRETWTAATPVSVTVACPEVIDATVSALDDQVRNVVTANRPDGPHITVRSQTSIDRFGAHTYTTSDLGVSDDEEVGRWVEVVLATFAYPRATLTDVTLRPAANPELWAAILDVDLVADRVRVLWSPPDTATTYDVVARVVGVQHTIDRHVWELQWTLGIAQPLGSVLTWGPDPQDQWSAGNAWGLAPSSTTVFLTTETGRLLGDENGNLLVAS